MLTRWLFKLTLWASSVPTASGASFIVNPNAAIQMPQEPEMQLMMPPGEWKPGSFSMNVTIVDAGEQLPKPQALVAKDGHKRHKKHVNVISSWILFHMSGNHTTALQKPVLPHLVGGLRDAVADALEVCRASLGIVDMRAINIDVVDKDDSFDKESEKDESDDDSSGDGANLLQRAAKMVRHMRTHVNDKESTHVNVTQIKAVYEVRVFDEMKVSEAEVGRRIDKLQIYSRFSDLSRLLSRSLAEVHGQEMEGVMLDDVGYAAKHEMDRPTLSGDDLADCAQEVSLHDARQIHQFIMAASLIMVALITCAGSAIFTIKHASSVPSRMNPLVSTQAD